jgi:hypothetical protein
MSFLENEVFTNGTFVNGEDISVVDMHIIWSLRWALKDLGAMQEKGVGKEDFPKVWKMIDGLPEIKPDVISGDEAAKTILEAEYSAPEPTIQKGDPLGLEKGAAVTIESLE